MPIQKAAVERMFPNVISYVQCTKCMDIMQPSGFPVSQGVHELNKSTSAKVLSLHFVSFDTHPCDYVWVAPAEASNVDQTEVR